MQHATVSSSSVIDSRGFSGGGTAALSDHYDLSGDATDVFQDCLYQHHRKAWTTNWFALTTTVLGPYGLKNVRRDKCL
jgi:hypothetical protein